MAKITLDNITTGFESLQKTNSNYDLIEAAIENTVSRDGTAPNYMSADFDMNSHRILNLPAPLSANEPARLADIADGVTLTALSLIYATVDTISALKAYTMSAALNGQFFYVRGHGTIGDGGEGFFRCTTTNPGTDNNGTRITSTTSGYYFIRQFQGSVYNVKWFGAKGDDSTNDYTAISACVLAAGTGVIYFPGGTYRSGTTITISSACMITGDGTYKSFISGSGLGVASYVMHIDGTISPNLEGFHMRDICLMSTNSSPDLLKINRASNSTFHNIGLRSARHGIVITGNRTFSLRFDHIIDVTGLTGTAVLYNSFTGGGHHTFTGCSLGGQYGVQIDTNSLVEQLSFVSCNFESCTVRGFQCVGSARGLSFFAPRVENCGDANYSFDFNPDPAKYILGLVIQGGWFDSNAPAYVVNIGGSGGVVRGFDFSGNWIYNYATSFVRLNGEGYSGTIANNYLDTCPAVVNTTHVGVLVYNNETLAAGSLSPTFSILTGSAVYDPANLADGAGVTTTVTVTGANLGDHAKASFSNDLQGILLTAWVSSANTVSVRFQNETTGAIDLASGTIRARVEPYN